MWLFSAMERAACLVEFHLILKLPGQMQGALRGCHRLGKPPGFGESGGKGMENDRTFHWLGAFSAASCDRNVTFLSKARSNIKSS
jgi:hypothetical protein